MIKFYCDVCECECENMKYLGLGRLENKGEDFTCYPSYDFADGSIKIDHICKICEDKLFKLVRGFVNK
jgi:hypothetical protein